MKKNSIRFIFSCLLLLMLCSAVSVSVFAMNQKVVDYADLLTDEQEANLQQRLQEIVDKYEMDMVIVTTDSCEGQNIQDYTEAFYEQNGYGCGANDDGMIFLVDMGDRKFHMAPIEGAMYVFTDYGMQRIDDIVSEELHDGEFYEAFQTYADLSDEFFAEAEKGTPFDTNHKYKQHMAMWLQILIAIVIGLIAAGVTLGCLYGQLKSVAPKREAQEYVKPGSFKLTRSTDLFLYRNVTSRKIEKSSGGGTSSHSTSGGHSAGGHTGSF